nr:leucine-rich repeat protein [Tanacetum cinerariifolium]
MKRRIRNNNHHTATYLRFLRPGALAQLRDSKLKTRCELPFGLAARVYAPRCPQRKKMMAIRAVIDVYESVVGGVDGFSSDFVAAH